MGRRHKIIGIYQIRCRANGRIYIGSSRDIFMRLNSHMVDLIMGTHHNDELQEDFHKYGFTSFDFSLLRSVNSLKDLKRIEQAEMDRYDRRVLYNKRRAAAKR